MVLWEREVGHEERVRRKAGKREQEPNDSPSMWEEALRGCKVEKRGFLLQTNPEEGAGSSISGGAETWAGMSFRNTCWRQRASPGRASRRMTSSLPVSVTEALLFQPLGRHDAMLSLKVSCLCLGFSWPPDWRGASSLNRHF